MSCVFIELPEKSKNRALIEARIRAVLDAQGDDICGFALVVWGSDTRSTADLGCEVTNGPHIPTILVPDFVRNRLLAQQIEVWTVDSMNGYEPPPKDGPA